MVVLVGDDFEVFALIGPNGFAQDPLAERLDG